MYIVYVQNCRQSEHGCLLNMVNTRTFALVIDVCEPCRTVWAIVSPTQGDLFLWGQVGTVSTQRARVLSASVCVIFTIITWKILNVIHRLSISLGMFFITMITFFYCWITIVSSVAHTTGQLKHATCAASCNIVIAVSMTVTTTA